MEASRATSYSRSENPVPAGHSGVYFVVVVMTHSIDNNIAGFAQTLLRIA